jgi:FkbM family methyltransferase
MIAPSKIRHSFIGRFVRGAIHLGFQFQHRSGNPVNYRLPGGVEVQLYPEGEIPEFLAVQRVFEKAEMGLTAAYLRPGMQVIDVGANVGVYSILAQKLVGNEGAVWAFEPSAESYGRLLKNLALNSCDRVQPIQVALSDQSEGFLRLGSDPGFGDAYRHLHPLDESDGSAAEIVPITTLDHYASEKNIDHVDFMKVDVEGFEYGVFAGSQRLLKSSPNIAIMFESEPEWCERAGRSQQDTFRLLKTIGLGLYAWQPRNHHWAMDEKALLSATTVWACYDQSRLPFIQRG